MSEYGYEIIAALVTDLNPDKLVKAAMNEINGMYTYMYFCICAYVFIYVYIFFLYIFL
jgi:hypothetical protein